MLTVEVHTVELTRRGSFERGRQRCSAHVEWKAKDDQVSACKNIEVAGCRQSKEDFGEVRMGMTSYQTSYQKMTDKHGNSRC